MVVTATSAMKYVRTCTHVDRKSIHILQKIIGYKHILFYSFHVTFHFLCVCGCICVRANHVCTHKHIFILWQAESDVMSDLHLRLLL